MAKPGDVVTKRITIECGIDAETNEPYWTAGYEDLVANTDSVDVITGFGMLVATVIDLAQGNGMLPMPPGQED